MSCQLVTDIRRKAICVNSMKKNEEKKKMFNKDNAINSLIFLGIGDAAFLMYGPKLWNKKLLIWHLNSPYN